MQGQEGRSEGGSCEEGGAEESGRQEGGEEGLKPSFLSWWTLSRATGAGVTAGLCALLLWPLYAVYQERLLWPFVITLAVTAFSGASILLMTLLDMLLVKRSDRVRPVRAFDLALGALLAFPAGIELEALSRQL